MHSAAAVFWLFDSHGVEKRSCNFRFGESPSPFPCFVETLFFSFRLVHAPSPRYFCFVHHCIFFRLVLLVDWLLCSSFICTLLSPIVKTNSQEPNIREPGGQGWLLRSVDWFIGHGRDAGLSFHGMKETDLATVCPSSSPASCHHVWLVFLGIIFWACSIYVWCHK